MKKRETMTEDIYEDLKYLRKLGGWVRGTNCSVEVILRVLFFLVFFIYLFPGTEQPVESLVLSPSPHQ